VASRLAGSFQVHRWSGSGSSSAQGSPQVSQAGSTSMDQNAPCPYDIPPPPPDPRRRLTRPRRHPPGPEEKVAEFPPLGMATRQLFQPAPVGFGQGLGRRLLWKASMVRGTTSQASCAPASTFVSLAPNMATNSSAIKGLGQTQHISSPATCSPNQEAYRHVQH
jgi:hypothetical protein